MDTNRVFDEIMMHLFNEQKKLCTWSVYKSQEDQYRIPSNCITIITCIEHPHQAYSFHSHFIHQYLLLICVFRVPTIKLCTFIVSIISSFYHNHKIYVYESLRSERYVIHIYTLVLKYFIMYLAFYLDDRYLHILYNVNSAPFIHIYMFI